MRTSIIPSRMRLFLKTFAHARQQCHLQLHDIKPDGVTIRDSISECGNPTSSIYFDDQNSTTVKSFDVDNFHSENSPTNAVITMRGLGQGTYTINRVFAQTAATLLDNAAG